ncbi:hypothetical protein COHA_003634 [Chlorella ohadii]|uniref:Methyltransferase FkbM domain-containing protein n=1 Tax=Chlorella ohadii TaxID=2649997 RepID=A0AAD5H6J4_9CHLO|nr:hypothetical protein COHA_003634 [Chlorella ohadii]
MPVVRPRPPQGNSQAPWGQLLVAAAAVVFLVLLGTGRIRIAPSISSAVPASPPGGSNQALRWADHPQSLALPGQLPHWLGAAARTPGSLQLEDGPLLNETVHFGSQDVGGDAWLYRNLFNKKRNGFFVEVGAGAGGSPTRSLQAAAGWRGMLIEGDAGAYRQLSLARPDAICLHAAICGGRFGTVHWASRAQQQQGSGSSGGIWELMPAERRQALRGGEESAQGLPTVQCFPLQYLLDKFGILAIDLLVVNVAGAELEVLSGLDFSRLAVKVLTVGRSGGSATGSGAQQGSSQAAAIAELLTQASFEAVPPASEGEAQHQGSWTVFVSSRLRHHLRQASEA